MAHPGSKCPKKCIFAKKLHELIRHQPQAKDFYSNIVSTLPLHTVCLVSETCENFHQISTSLYHVVLLQLES